MKSIKNKKRIVLGTLSTAAIVAVPVVTVISCGEVKRLENKIRKLQRYQEIDLKKDTVSNNFNDVVAVVQSALTNDSTRDGFSKLGSLDQRRFKHSMRLEEIARLRSEEESKFANTTQDKKIAFDITKWATEFEKYFLNGMKERVVIEGITFHWTNRSSYKFHVGYEYSLVETLDKLRDARLSLIDKMESSEYKSYLRKYKRALLKRDNLELWKLDNETYSKMFDEISDIYETIRKFVLEAKDSIYKIIQNDWGNSSYWRK